MSRPPVSRRANVALIAALLTPVMIGMVAIAVDLGLLSHAKQQLEVATDNCAMAAARCLANKGIALDADDREETIADAVQYGYDFMAQNNPVLTISLQADIIQSGVPFIDANGRLTGEFFPDPLSYDAVYVKSTMSGGQELPAFFGQIYGRDHYEPQAEAIAQLKNAGTALLPFAVKDSTWANHLNPDHPDYQDNWAWNEASQTVIENASDIVPEVVMYPESGSGCPGNFGALNISFDSMSDSLFVDQVLNGVTVEQLEIEFGEPFSLSLDTYTWVDPNDPTNIYEFGKALIDPDDQDISGNPGLSNSSGLQNALTERTGQVVGVFLWDVCTDQGSNAAYSITEIRFGRLMGFDLTGNPKAVWIQPTSSPPDNQILGKLEVVGIGY